MDVEVSASGFTKKMELDLLNKDFDSISLSDEEQDNDTTGYDNYDCTGETSEEFYSCDETENDLELPSNERVEIETLPNSDCISSNSEILSCNSTIRSYSTCSTIAPEVIKNKVKKALMNREKKELRKRIVAKGEASATTRIRRENRDTIKECDGIWGWE